MTSENPYEPADFDEATSVSDEVPTERAAYNVVTDTVIGLNTRKSDNRFQLKCILIAIPVCGLLMMVLAIMNPGWNLPWQGGAIIGAFAGLVVGTFGSGIFLMFYRAIRHMQGKHD